MFLFHHLFKVNLKIILNYLQEYTNVFKEKIGVKYVLKLQM